ncbi:hypothetical protein B0H13DRAFT_2339718 [Mycena leptocephala]|nr:hypothetical protein B0H13DRAFT_2339718 [Mycena leptocephala]
MSVPNRPIVHSPRSVSASGLTPSTAVSAFASHGATSAFDMSPPPTVSTSTAYSEQFGDAASYAAVDPHSHGMDMHSHANPHAYPLSVADPPAAAFTAPAPAHVPVRVDVDARVARDARESASLTPASAGPPKEGELWGGEGEEGAEENCEVMWAARRDFAFPFSRRQTVLYWSSMPKVRAAAAAFTYVPSLTAATAFWMTSSFANDA